MQRAVRGWADGRGEMEAIDWHLELLKLIGTTQVNDLN